MGKYDRKERDREYDRSRDKYINNKDKYTSKEEKYSKLDKNRKNPNYGRYGTIK